MTKQKDKTSDQNTKPGLIRKEIYAYLESQGFEITKERHKHLSHLLKLMANAKNEEIMRKLVDESTMRYQYEIKLGIRTPAGQLIDQQNHGNKEI
jgi:hypothetical protein